MSRTIVKRLTKRFFFSMKNKVSLIYFDYFMVFENSFDLFLFVFHRLDTRARWHFSFCSLNSAQTLIIYEWNKALTCYLSHLSISFSFFNIIVDTFVRLRKIRLIAMLVFFSERTTTKPEPEFTFFPLIINILIKPSK